MENESGVGKRGFFFLVGGWRKDEVEEKKHREKEREKQGNGGICLRAWCDVGRVREGERLGGKRGGSPPEQQ